MAKRNTHKLTTGLIAACLMAYGAGAAAQQLIVNPGVEKDALSAEGVRAVFTMRLRRWADGTPVRVFVLPDRHPTHRAFTKQYLGVFPHQLRRSWDRLVFSGTGQTPVEVADELEMLDFVASTPGAVGYVSEEMALDRVRLMSVE